MVSELGGSAPQSPSRIRVGVLTGGASAERDISLAAGAQIAASLDPGRFAAQYFRN